MSKPLSPEEMSPLKSEIQRSPLSSDVEKQSPHEPSTTEKESVFRSLGLLDRFLALWILLAMAVGIILGNFVPNTGPALQKGKFVGVSVPIGMLLLFFREAG
jgi:ACR3 family arsenite transporter